MIEPNDPSVIERSLFQPFLEPGEKVIWTGKPARLRWFGSDNWNKIVAGFAVMFMLPSAMAVGSDAARCRTTSYR